ncbi:MAG: acetate kinase [Gammaproteobacteria bacterium]|nr:acetate kinase [Gammaproteobacteria bacterium]
MNDEAKSEQLILVVNTGSSSIKYSLFHLPEESLVIHGEISGLASEHKKHCIHLYDSDRPTMVVEDDHVEFDTHEQGIRAVIDVLSRFNQSVRPLSLSAISHRFVHGGDTFIAPVLVDKYVVQQLKQLTHLAPLHNPSNLLGITLCHHLLPEIPQVVVFDTAFHQTLPDYAYRYAIPQAWYLDHKIRRYGFHGLSHSYVAQQAADLMDRPLESLNIISLHLGNGASICAIKQGQSIDTSMGFTPLEGLVMGSRSGDIDPSIPLYIQQKYGLTNEHIEHSLNYDSGLVALAGTNDVQALLEREQAGDHNARLALAIYIYRIRKYIGAYLVALGQVDAIIFTAGIGENSAEIRTRCCQDLEQFGIKLATERNQQILSQATIINDSDSAIKILVIPTNEELQIAHETKSFLDSANRVD